MLARSEPPKLKRLRELLGPDLGCYTLVPTAVDSFEFISGKPYEEYDQSAVDKARRERKGGKKTEKNAAGLKREWVGVETLAW